MGCGDSQATEEKGNIPAAAPNTSVRLEPFFDIKDYDATVAALQEFVELTKTEEGNLFYGWTISEDKTKLHCREGYVDGASVAAHLANVGAKLGSVLESGAISLSSLLAMGPADELDAMKEAAKDLPVVYYVDSDTNPVFRDITKFDVIMNTVLFDIKEDAKIEGLKAAVQDLTGAVAGEADCLSYAFYLTEDNKKGAFREAWGSADGVKEHLKNVAELLPPFMAFVDVAGVSVHGPSAELDQLKEDLKAWGPVYYVTQDGGIIGKAGSASADAKGEDAQEEVPAVLETVKPVDAADDAKKADAEPAADAGADAAEAAAEADADAKDAGEADASADDKKQFMPKNPGTGPIQVDISDGSDKYICRCGQSNNFPYCDGSHGDSGVTPLKVNKEDQGKDAVWVCSCGLAKGRTDAPWCDGSHASLNQDSA